ncbi:MAG TPA: hypothetical protein DHU80_05585 [Cryomorphaceae bacterium]|nr:hypothetical protein [Cryomorphaceae bacterium]
MLYQISCGTYTLNSYKASKKMFLSALPIQEKVESYSPFVMNNQTEIMEAMRYYHMGKMGVLIERDLP